MVVSYPVQQKKPLHFLHFLHPERPRQMGVRHLPGGKVRVRRLLTFQFSREFNTTEAP